MKGQAAVNTTRDYIRAAVFFANSAILLTTFSVGYAGKLKNKEKPAHVPPPGRVFFYLILPRMGRNVA